LTLPPKPSPRPPAVIAFGWLWAVAVLLQLGALFPRMTGGNHFAGPDYAELALVVLFAAGGWLVAAYAVQPIESGMLMGVIFAGGNQGLRLFNAVQDGQVSPAALLPLALVAMQGLALLLLRTGAARDWLDANWAATQAFFATDRS
jgi:hypothetical protein